MHEELGVVVTQASFLLGMSMAALYSVQSHLIQGNQKEALTVINEAVRALNEKVEKVFYKKSEGADDAK